MLYPLELRAPQEDLLRIDYRGSARGRKVPSKVRHRLQVELAQSGKVLRRVDDGRRRAGAQPWWPRFDDDKGRDTAHDWNGCGPAR
jgi:hypothetical protein